MKLSPFALFIILILVLVIATTFSGLNQEGFITFGQSNNPLTPAFVSGYDSSTKIIKLYDDIYYDSRNGNVVFISELNGTINKIDIVQRDPAQSPVSVSKGRDSTDFSDVSTESKINTIMQTYSSYITRRSTTNIIYNPWGNDTHMYLFDVTDNTGGNTAVKPVLTVSYNGTDRYQYNTSFTDVTIPISSTYTASSDSKNNTMVPVTEYSTRGLYQLVPTVFYDVSNGNLLVKNAATYDVYERGSSVKSTDTMTNLSSKSFSQITKQPSFINDAEGNNTILYHPLGEYTHIMVLGNTLNDGLLKVVNSKKFDMNGVYSPSGMQQIDAGTGTSGLETSDGELLDAFSKWYMYFYGNDFIDNSEDSKYLLKTQVVPPVCPSCPSCSGNGICTDCGGQGGSGTKNATGSLAFSDGKTLIGATGNAVSNAVGATGNVLSNTVGATGNVLSNTVDATGKVLTGAVGTTGEVVTKTVDTAGNVVTGVVGKTLDTAGNIVGKTLDTAGNIVGSLGLDRVGYSQSYGGPVNTSSSANAQGYGPNRNLTGYSSLPNGNPRDPYSYNGKLQSKGANFIPVTADFSNFGR